MATTCTNVPTAAARSALRRRVTHQQRIGDAATFRAKFWRLAGWLAAEGKRLTPAEQDALLRRLTAVAAELNERSAA